MVDKKWGLLSEEFSLIVLCKKENLEPLAFGNPDSFYSLEWP